MEIDMNDCIVVQQEGGEVGKRSVGVADPPDPAGTSASAVSYTHLTLPTIYSV